jgi:hypothetical protein
MGIISKELCSLDYMKVNPQGYLYTNQIDAAKDVIRCFDSDKPKTNYVIIKGFTQSGKTGIFHGLVNIITEYNLQQHLGVNKILYITGDNSRDLISQTKERGNKSLCDNSGTNKIVIHYMKRSDLSKYNRHSFNELNNSIIFIDESHFGTSKEQNILPQFLKYYGIDYLKNNNDLSNKNVYIISNSATPYLEWNSDIVGNKSYVFFKPSEGYIGLLDFYNQNLIQPIENKSLKTKDQRKKIYEKIFTSSYKHLSDIEEKKGKKKCMIFRLNNSKDLNIINNIVNTKECKFQIYEFDTKGGKSLKYDDLWEKIAYKCACNKLDEDEYLLIIVKDALRMGITIPLEWEKSEVKNLIGVVYDVASDSEKLPTVTEQGLLGRMCGYRNDNEWEDIKFFCNKNHINTLVNHYINDTINSDSVIKLQTCRETEKYIECTDLDIKGKYFNENIKNDVNRENLISQGLVYTVLPNSNVYESDYDAYDYLSSKVGTTYHGIDNFQLKDLISKGKKNSNVKKIPVAKIVHEFLCNYDEKYKKYINKGTRRTIDIEEDGNWAKTFIENINSPNKPLCVSGSAYKIKVEEVNQIAYQALMNLDNWNDLEKPSIPIRVKLSELKYHLIEKNIEYNDINKTAETMITEE